MSDFINGVGGSFRSNEPEKEKNVKQPEDINLNDISILYSTKKTEKERGTFSETYEEKYIDQLKDGAKFLEGLRNSSNKEILMKELGISDEEYDTYACIALALASQETGMGEEAGYVRENEGISGAWHKFKKWAHVKFFDGASASSGLTQMKIYDFLNSNKLTDDQKQILKDMGITAKGIATNNLYSNPDKAAVATIVVLKSLSDNYDNYKEVLENTHNSIVFNDNLTEEERLDKGQSILNDISSMYTNADDETRVEIRETFKQWLLSTPNNKNKDYNEEQQLKLLNNLFKGTGSSLQLSQSDLDYIRYNLTADGKEMTMTEYCAYAWNKGTEESGMAPDRLLADKIGILLSNPEDFDYDQFTVNVSTLAQKYAEQTIDDEVMLHLNSAFNHELDEI